MKYKVALFIVEDDVDSDRIESWMNIQAEKGYNVHSIVALRNPSERYPQVMITMETFDDDEDGESRSRMGVLPGSYADPDSVTNPETELDPLDNDFWGEVLSDMDN